MKHFRKGFNTTMGVFAAILTMGLITSVANAIVGGSTKAEKVEEEKDKEAEE